MTPQIKRNTVFNGASWGSVFAIAWLLISNAIEPTRLVWGFWIFFLLLAVGSSINMFFIDGAELLKKKKEGQDG